ncbi:MAG: lytic transglycosylase domain-containing protein [Methylobacteriaceae bacterium]|nr:lytic transglycosylase domain-containing protein [Methylobacteriaceae bacterium]
MALWRLICLSAVIVLAASAPVLAQEETVGQALCRLIETSASSRHLPLEFFTRLIWRESSFRTGVVSPTGAQGVAQFMPRTAAARGLTDPFDPEQAIPASAAFLSDLLTQFGNFGLAAAAYNAGPTRLANWLDAKASLPQETRDYVRFITGRSVDDWAQDKAAGEEQQTRPAPPPAQTRSCLELAANLRRGVPAERVETVLAAFAPWGVQLAGNFSKELALATFARARQRYAAIIGSLQPMIIGTRLRSRGTRAFYRIRLPAQSRAAADALCNRIHGVGGACVSLRT